MDNKIFITEKDYMRLNNLLNSDYEDENNCLENLENEIERANIISDSEVPPDLVTMNSKIEYLDLTTKRSSTITISYPDNANYLEKNISILAPLGCALIGLREGQEILWDFPSGATKKLKIIKVIYQPEASGDVHL
ncbi:nucleoside diphosphate kinase regulator [Halobacteriovorax sp. ZH4_bin.1]|uniref:nucleoside diphosphate kinase regulator n=1 Tax=unclassified Halobacteriovorax TaxID=2639665 RepID=UPI003716408C